MTPRCPAGRLGITYNGKNGNFAFATNQTAYFLPLPFPLAVELVEVTLDARDGADELPLDLVDLTLSRALFCASVSEPPPDSSKNLGHNIP